MQILVYPIDKNGFILWTSERYRFEDSSYKPLADEIIMPIPLDVTFVQPRWDGASWVEGKGHPGFPEQPEQPADPDDGVYFLFEPERTMFEMTNYFSTMDIDVLDVIENNQHLCSVYTIPVLVKMIQDLQVRVNELESARR